MDNSTVPSYPVFNFERIPLLGLVNSIADGCEGAPTPVQSGDEYLVAMERPPDLR